MWKWIQIRRNLLESIFIRKLTCSLLKSNSIFQGNLKQFHCKPESLFDNWTAANMAALTSATARHGSAIQGWASVLSVATFEDIWAPQQSQYYISNSKEIIESRLQTSVQPTLCTYWSSRLNNWCSSFACYTLATKEYMTNNRVCYIKNMTSSTKPEVHNI